MSIYELPCETLRTVFENVGSHDVPKLRTVCKKFNTVIQRNYCFLPRIAYIVKIYAINGEIMIANKKSGNATGCTQVRKFTESYNLFTFDFNRWREIGIVEIEFADLNGCELQEVSNAFRIVLDQMMNTRQSQLREMTFRNVILSQEQGPEIQTLFAIAFNQCENIVVDKCKLPLEISENSVNYSKFDHFRWIASTAFQPVPSDVILAKMQHDMKFAVNKRSFQAEMDSASVEAVCSFLEEWLRLPIASFFNLSFHNCDDEWKPRFLAECTRRQLTHNYMEFQSKTHSNAHVKVSFSQDASTCCIWPVLDVPARTTGQSVCYARYFRDF